MCWCPDCGRMLTMDDIVFLGSRCNECTVAMFNKAEAKAVTSASRNGRKEARRKKWEKQG